MDIDIYHFIGWLFAIGMTVYGLLATRNKRMVPLFLLAGMVLLVGAGQHGGLAVIEPRWQNERYQFGFVVASIGLVLWALAFRTKRDNESAEPATKSDKPRD
jgi:peptidoglycan/LPS O-acetylase OafA/YrhL